MNLEKSHRRKPKRPFAGCVELIPSLSDFVEFIDGHRIWGFRFHHLKQFILQECSGQGNPKTAPPDQLILVYPSALVVLVGWRLELVIGQLACGRIARVHAEKHLGALMIEEAWVSEIHVLPYDDTILRPEQWRGW